MEFQPFHPPRLTVPGSNVEEEDNTTTDDDDDRSSDSGHGSSPHSDHEEDMDELPTPITPAHPSPSPSSQSPTLPTRPFANRLATSIHSSPEAPAQSSTSAVEAESPQRATTGLLVDHRDMMTVLPISAQEDPIALRTTKSGDSLGVGRNGLKFFAARQAPMSGFTIPHLPPAGPCQKLTSLPIWLVQRDLEFAAKRLLSLDVYQDFVGNPHGRAIFRQFLVKEKTVGGLDCEWDSKVLEELAGQIRTASQGIYDGYIDRRSPTSINISGQLRQNILDSLRQLAVVDAGLSSAQKHLLGELYKGAFQRYCKARLIEASQVKLGYQHLTDGRWIGRLFLCH